MTRQFSASSKFAFHFEVRNFAVSYDEQFQKPFFTSVAELPADQLDAQLRIGDLLVAAGASYLQERVPMDRGYSETWSVDKAVASRMIDAITLDPSRWKGTGASRLAYLLCLTKQRVYVINADGLSAQQANVLHGLLERRVGSQYLGVLATRPNDPNHRALYDQFLVRRFHVVGHALNILYSRYWEDQPPVPTWMADLPLTVGFEDAGVPWAS